MWSEAKCAGIALAAVLWDDRRLSGLDTALPDAARDGARAHLTSMDSQALEGKHRGMRELITQVRGELTTLDHLPMRARALLARHVPREHGRRLIADVREARPDFDASPALVQTLLRQARILPSQPSTADAAKNPER